LVEAALYNQNAISKATGALEQTILRLSNRVPEHIAQSVSASVVEEVKVLVSTVAEELATTMTKQLVAAAKEADNAATIYRAMALRAKEANENSFRQTMCLALGSSLLVSLIVSWVTVHFCRQ
jgi:cell division inhibitor SulA